MWSDERNRFNIETVKAMVMVKTHFCGVSCMSFYSFLLGHRKYRAHRNNKKRVVQGGFKPGYPFKYASECKYLTENSIIYIPKTYENWKWSSERMSLYQFCS